MIDRRTRLTAKEIRQIKICRSKGNSIKDLIARFDVSRTTISWHTNPKFKERLKRINLKWRRKPETKDRLNKDCLAYYQKHKNELRTKQNVRNRKRLIFLKRHPEIYKQYLKEQHDCYRRKMRKLKREGKYPAFLKKMRESNKKSYWKNKS